MFGANTFGSEFPAGVYPIFIATGVTPYRGIKSVVVAYPNTPALFPAGGTIYPDSASALGFTYEQAPASFDVLVVGQFLVGTQNVQNPEEIFFNQPTLFLKGRKTLAYTAAQIINVKITGKPTLTLKGKSFVPVVWYRLNFDTAQLLLTGKQTFVSLPPVARMRKAVLNLLGQPTDLVVSEVLDILNGGILYLTGVPTIGKVPGLIPTVPESFSPVPTYPIESISPPATVAQDLILVPTVERVL